MSLEAIKYSPTKLEILDQTLLPQETKYIRIQNVEDGWKAINSMQVRGAPAIAMVGILSLRMDLNRTIYENKTKLFDAIEAKLDYLVSARPTAVNIKLAAQELKDLAENLEGEQPVTVDEMLTTIFERMDDMIARDLRDNQALGDFGALEMLKNLADDQMVRVLTHCNTGSLATTGYGTALGVVRSLQRDRRLEHVYCTETRPYNQGARLTAYELVYEDIPATLICDSMVAALMKSRAISGVVVGADRVAANGDTANKIGTYQIAIVAKHHDVPFYVAAPTTSIDFSIPDGDSISIEERPEREMTHLNGQRIAAAGIKCWNPAFDVTPAQLITGIVTERGVFKPEALHELSAVLKNL